jgi:hypothetical protein
MFERRRDAARPTYSSSLADGTLQRYFSPPNLSHLSTTREAVIGVTGHYLDHRFELLGSGWVRVFYGMPCRGLEGYGYAVGEKIEADKDGDWLTRRIHGANLAVARSIWRLVDGGYRPIDWQLDFKSGYRWSERTWYKDVDYSPEPGVDIKVPWELARMQHLPQIALAYGLAKSEANGTNGCSEIGETKNAGGRLKSPETYVHEFRNQVLDFIATNPPRFGVNWKYSMEVGIRVVNWLVAYDFLKALGAPFDLPFETVFMKSVHEHGLHIANHLEWHEKLRTNHYLANLVGLVFVGAYLPRTQETDAWLSFGVQELIRETRHQFYDDGGNCEASTSYHRLSAEMVVYATALVLALSRERVAALKEYDHTLMGKRPGLSPSPMPFYSIPRAKTFVQNTESGWVQHESPFPAWYFERIEKMVEFTMHVAKPNNTVPQIGDNDSGRLLKLNPIYEGLTVKEAKERYENLEGYDQLQDEDVYWDERTLDHRHLASAAGGLFRREDFDNFAGNVRFEKMIIHSLSGGGNIGSYKGDEEPSQAMGRCIGGEDDLNDLMKKFGGLPGYVSHCTDIPIDGQNLKEGMELYGYPDFGLFIFRSKRMYVAVRCGPVGQSGFGGHAHNDQLGLELSIDGIDQWADPGTYLYMPLPAYRDAYRSVKAHFAPQSKDGREPGKMNLGLFQLGDEAKAKCLYFGENGFVGCHWGFGEPVYRIVTWTQQGLRIIDYQKERSHLNSGSRRRVRRDQTLKFIGFSKGYGVRMRQPGCKTFQDREIGKRVSP